MNKVHGFERGGGGGGRGIPNNFTAYLFKVIFLKKIENDYIEGLPIITTILEKQLSHSRSDKH